MSNSNSQAQTKRPLRILIQGGIASGKSTIARLLGEREGASVLDCDRIAHEVLESAEVRAGVLAAFGEQVFEATPDTPLAGRPVSRPALAEVVFNDAEALARLEALIHPEVAARVERHEQAESVSEGPRRVVVLDAAVADKMGLDEACDLRLFVRTSAETRAARAATRGWDEAELGRREARQRGLPAKLAAADAVIENNEGTAEAAAQIDQIWRELIEPRRAD